MKVPAVPFAGEGLGRSEQGAFLGWTAPLRPDRRGRWRIEVSSEEHTRDHMDGGRESLQIFLSGVAPIAEAPNPSVGQLGRDKVDDLAGQGATRVIRQLELAGLGLF